MSSTEDAVDQPSSPHLERPSSKKSRYDESSSEDDDYYSNFDKMLERNKKTHQKNAPKNEPVFTKASTPKLLSSSDSESDVEEIKEENTLESLLKKGKKFNEDREKQICAEMDKIKELAKVNEAETGAIPDMMYCDPIADEAVKRIRHLKEDRKTAFERRPSLDSSSSNYVECVVIDKNGRERTERDYGGHAAASLERKGPEVTILFKDLHKNITRIEKMGYEAPMRSFVERITKEWNCKDTEVVLTLEKTPITDLDQSLSQLEVSLDGILDISAVYVPSIHPDKSAAPVAPRDPNMISIKFQCGTGKPAIIEMNKTSPFSDILGEVAERLKMETVGRMVFDCEKIDFSLSPTELDMDDADCVDVYAK